MPKTFLALKDAGYRFANHGKCRGCKEEVEWWVAPSGKRIPYGLMPKESSPAVNHYPRCPESDNFRQ